MKGHNRRIILFVIIVALLIWLGLYFGLGTDRDSTLYSALNRGKDGASVIYQTMKEVDYPVNIVGEEIQNRNMEAVQLIIEPNDTANFDIEEEVVKNWVGKGGIIILLDTNWGNKRLNYGEKIEEYFDIHTNEKEAIIYKYNKGYIVLGNSTLFRNDNLFTNRNGAYWVLDELDKFKYSSIEFNEYYIRFWKEGPSLWKDMPLGIKFIFYQICLVIIAIIIRRGKRFGKIVPLIDEIERSDNEYIEAVTNLYKNSGSWEIVLDEFYGEFLMVCSKVFNKDYEYIKENWLEYWREENLAKYDHAKDIYNFINNSPNNIYKKKNKSKKYLDMITKMEELRKILKKRREKLWEQSIPKKS